MAHPDRDAAPAPASTAKSIVARSPVASSRAPDSVRRPGVAMPSHQSEMTEALSRPGAAGQKHQKQHTTLAWDRASLYIKRASSSSALLSITVFLASFSLLLGTATAQQVHDRQRAPTVPIDQDPAWKAPLFLVVDERPPPPAPALMHLYRRDDATPSSKPSSQTLDTDENAPTESPIARPFDTALGNNFTAPCSAWFKTFLADETINACHPFSLLLQTSGSFFDASKSYTRITTTLEATCNVNSTVCLGYMNKYARDIKSNDNCAVDYANDNPSVLQAYNGLVAYEPLYQAACLKDDGGKYCFANAITNASAVTDSYPYYLPLGVNLPGGARPGCSTCLQDTMAIFSSFAGNTTQPISRTYSSAAQQLEINCGPTFINQSATPLKAAASGPVVPLTGTMYLLMTLFFYFLL